MGEQERPAPRDPRSANELPRIPRYELVEEVGSGGMSVVYRARDTTLDREVAVKVLHRHLAGRENERKRFRQEAQAVARLSHPNILEIHDYSGEDTSDAWIVSEFIRGPTLRAFGESEGFGLPEIGALITERLARALAHAHAQGIIHRDLKPENVMVQDDGTIKLTDFGIARMVDRDTRMTMTGTLLGSPAHMAPEIIEGKGCDARSDIFSLGTVLYWLCCGALPFRGESAAEVLRKILDGEYPDPRQIDPRVSDALAGIVHKAMARDPAERYESVEAMADALAAHLAALGLERPEDEVRAFFAQPAAYKEALRARLVEAWITRAQAAHREGRIPEAIAACDSALALHPAEARATLLLDRIRRHRERRRLLLGIGATVGLAGAAAALIALWPARTAPPPPPPVPSTEDPGTPAPPKRPPPQRTHADPAPLRDDSGAGRGAAAPGPEAASNQAASNQAASASPRQPRDPHPGAGVPVTTHTPSGAAPVASGRRPRRPLRILVEPYADIYVDGRHLAQDREARLEVTTGTHRLRLLRDGFVPIDERLQVPPGKGSVEVRRRLEPRPATLRVLCPQEGVLTLGDKLIGPVVGGKREVPVTFPAGPDGRYLLERRLPVRIERPGFVPYTGTVRLRPGERQTLSITLEPAP